MVNNLNIQQILSNFGSVIDCMTPLQKFMMPALILPTLKRFLCTYNKYVFIYTVMQACRQIKYVEQITLSDRFMSAIRHGTPLLQSTELNIVRCRGPVGYHNIVIVHYTKYRMIVQGVFQEIIKTMQFHPLTKHAEYGSTYLNLIKVIMTQYCELAMFEFYRQQLKRACSR